MNEPNSSATTKKPRQTISWAILGTGSIATDMVQILKQLPSTQVLAVGSRTMESANRFADRWGIPRRYESYDAACSDSEVDVVYVATPSLRHPQDCLVALDHGKAVLCEKSMAPNQDLAKEVLDYAKSKNLLFVHGVWSRFFPAMQKVRDLIDSGMIGDVRSARASFAQNDGAGSCSALLETGIYCAQFLQWVLSDPSDEKCHPVVRGACRRTHAESGNDEHVTAILEFPGNKLGTFECSLAHCSERSAAVYGTGGVIEVPFPFWCPTEIKVTTMSGQASQRWEGPQVFKFNLPDSIQPLSAKGEDGPPSFHFVNSEGLAYEAEEVNRCVREGLTESPKFSSAQCLDVMRIISEIDSLSRENS